MHGKHDLKIDSARIVDHVNGSAVQCRRPFCDRQAKAGAAGFRTACGDALDETLEDLLTHVFGDLRTGVDDIRDHMFAAMVNMRFHNHICAVQRMLESIGDDVREQLPQAIDVTFHHNVIWHMCFNGMFSAIVGERERGDRLVDEIGEIELLDIKAR